MIRNSTQQFLCPLCQGSATVLRLERESHAGFWSLARCGRCTLHFTTPSPSFEQIVQFYSGDYHQDLMDDAVTEHRFGRKFGRYADWIAGHIPAGKCLDIGCSTGLFPRILCDRGYEAEGIEINESCAAWGRREYGVVIHNTPIEECGFEEGTFDVISMTDVAEHMQDPLFFLSEVRRYLRPNGLALVTFPDIQSIESRYWYILSKLLRRSWLWRNCHVPMHIWEFTYRSALLCFEKAGFVIEDFRRTYDAPRHDSLPLRLLSLPTHVLTLPGLATRLGTQMEFILRNLPGNQHA